MMPAQLVNAKDRVSIFDRPPTGPVSLFFCHAADGEERTGPKGPKCSDPDAACQMPEIEPCYSVHTWQTSAFASPDAKGLYILPDTGAVGNLCGSSWAQNAVQHMRRAKLPFNVHQQPHPKTHGGVGQGASMSHWQIEIPMTPGKRPYVYTVDVVEGASANVPALTGTTDMSKLDVYYSVRTGSFVIPGPGGIDLGASPGTEIVQMRRKRGQFSLVPASLRASLQELARCL